MAVLTLSVLFGALWGVVRAQTITFQSLDASSSSASLPSGNSSFVFDGSNSDIAQQLYVRYKAGDTCDQATLASIPTAVTDRLEPLNINFNSLPGLVQRAVLWDSGFGISPGNEPIQIWTLENYSMAQIAVPKYEVANVDCTFLNCSQPNDVEAYYTKYCTGYQILNASRCVADTFEDPGAGDFLGMMWSTGGDPDMTPELRFRDHTWTQDVEQFGGNITFSVYSVHTVSSSEDPAWDVCPSGYASVTVPCHRRDEFTDAFMAANTTKPTGSAWVTTWLQQEFAQDSGFDMLLLIPIVLGAVAVVGLVGVFWRWRVKKKEQEKTLSNAWEHSGDYSYFMSGSEPGEMVLRPMIVTSQLSTQLSSLSSHYESAGSNKTLKILLGSEHLQDKYMPFDSLVFQKALSKGASGEVWICEYNGRKVAVKRLLQSKEQKAQNVQAFAEEIELGASLVHPHIVEFIGVAWNTLNNLVMVLEYLPKGSLQQYLKLDGSQLSWWMGKLHMAVGIAQALEYLHGRSPSLIHRDLKSSNILLTEELEPKLIDFGVSRDRAEATMTGGIGTPYWTAPEILIGKRYTEQADIYSFGVVLSELDTGKSPYSDTLTECGGMPKPFYILQDVMAGKLRPSFSPTCPLHVLQLGLSCLAIDPANRPTARELVQWLENSDGEQ
ncbi:hypothetical protein PRIC2_010058 [Phytophthora ramorum]